MKSVSNKINTWIQIIGWYQLIGGILGIFFVILSILNLSIVNSLNVLVYFLMFLFFAYSIFCGIICLKQNATALKYSLINQFLQLIGFAVFGFAFMYVAGTYLSIGLDLSQSVNLKFNAGLSMFDFNFNNEIGRKEIYFNLIAFGLIYWIDKIIRTIKFENREVI